MQPYGRIKKTMGFNSKIDYRLHFNARKVYSWWEDLSQPVSRRNLKQKIKSEIECEIWQMYEDERLWMEAFFND